MDNKRMIKDLDWDLLYTIDTMSLEYIWKYIVPEIEEEMCGPYCGVIHDHIHTVKSSDILIQPHSWYNPRQQKHMPTMYVYRVVSCRHHKYAGTLPLGLLATLAKDSVFPDTVDYESGGGTPIKAVKNADGDYEVYIWNP